MKIGKRFFDSLFFFFTHFSKMALDMTQSRTQTVIIGNIECFAKLENINAEIKGKYAALWEMINEKK
jgi:hypothetical protein